MIKPEKIHKRFWESHYDRAEFLWNLYRSYSTRNQRVLTGVYLDIGTGNLANTILFRQMTGAENVVGIDIRSDLAKSQDAELVRADSRALPFRDQSFELVTMISLIEYVPDPFACLSEGLRVLESKGELFAQFPNRYFPIELHSGLYMYFYLPKRLRNWLADKAHLGWMKEIDVPRLGKIEKILRKLVPIGRVVTAGFFYPESLLPQSVWIRLLHRVLKRLKIFSILPMGYIALVSLQPREYASNL